MTNSHDTPREHVTSWSTATDGFTRGSSCPVRDFSTPETSDGHSSSISVSIIGRPNGASMSRRGRKCLAAVVLLLVCVALFAVATPAEAAAGDDIRLSATINGRTVGGERITLAADETTHLVITVFNNRPESVDIRSIRTSGRVFGLVFYVFDVSVKLAVPAHGSAVWRLDVDTNDLNSQATGLLPINISLRDTSRHVVASTDGNADVRGSLASTYGTFGLAMLGVSAVLWVAVLITMARRRLPVNRARRALRFVPGGCGLGIVAVVSLSVLRVTAPSATSEPFLILGMGLFSFALGYLTPDPGPRRPPWDDAAGSRRPPGRAASAGRPASPTGATSSSPRPVASPGVDR